MGERMINAALDGALEYLLLGIVIFAVVCLQKVFSTSKSNENTNQSLTPNNELEEKKQILKQAKEDLSKIDTNQVVEDFNNGIITFEQQQKLLDLEQELQEIVATYPAIIKDMEKERKDSIIMEEKPLEQSNEKLNLNNDKKEYEIQQNEVNATIQNVEKHTKTLSLKTINKLEKLNTLKEKGIITDEEFKYQKDQLLYYTKANSKRKNKAQKEKIDLNEIFHYFLLAVLITFIICLAIVSIYSASSQLEETSYFVGLLIKLSLVLYYMLRNHSKVLYWICLITLGLGTLNDILHIYEYDVIGIILTIFETLLWYHILTLKPVARTNNTNQNEFEKEDDDD